MSDADTLPDATSLSDGAVDSPPTDPISVGFGVTYQKVGSGSSVLIVYGGYTAQLAWSQAWSLELWRARLKALGVGHVYAAQGPKDPGYQAKEIGNSGLRAHLNGPIADQARFIFVVAHSSGAFVAHELLQQLNTAGAVGTLGKIVYADLDGGGSGFDTTVAASLKRVAFIYGRDSTLTNGLSANASAAMSLGTTYAAYGSSFEVTVQGSGCNDGAKWCLHDLMATHRPHNPDTYDLARDYTDFVNRPVTTEYVSFLAAYLNRAPGR